jgi:hypothetical protein
VVVLVALSLLWQAERAKILPWLFEREVMACAASPSSLYVSLRDRGGVRLAFARPDVGGGEAVYAVSGALLPLWVKIVYTLFVGVLVPVYLWHYGPANFLWFSDVALLAMVPGLWAESPLIASTMMLAVGLPELVWNLDFFARLITGRAPLGLAAYMFDSSLPRFLRALSLFHVVLPVLLVWTLARLGYDPRALAVQTILGTALIVLSYTLTKPVENVNWVFGPGARPQRRVPRLVYLAAVLVFFPLVVYWPTHLVLLKVLPVTR